MRDTHMKAPICSIFAIATILLLGGCGDLTGPDVDLDRERGQRPTGSLQILLCPLEGCPEPPSWTVEHPDTLDTEETRHRTEA